MEVVVKKSDKIAFFLTGPKGLPGVFPYLAQILSQKGIKMIPISEKDFIEIQKSSLGILISLTRNLEERSKLNRFKEKFLKFLMKSNKCFFIDITSFSSFEENFNFPVKKSYCHLPLPINRYHLADIIAQKTFEYYKDDVKWPGGKKRRAPIGFFEEA